VGTLRGHPRHTRCPRTGRILAGVPTRLLLPAVGALALLAAAVFLAPDAVVATGLVIAALTVLGLGALAADWEKHPSFEEREQVRARRRRERWEATAGPRARDRARWEAYQAKKAEKAARAQKATENPS
jgi:hypothetical protein